MFFKISSLFLKFSVVFGEVLEVLGRSGRLRGRICTHFHQKRTGGFRAITKKYVLFLQFSLFLASGSVFFAFDAILLQFSINLRADVRGKNRQHQLNTFAKGLRGTNKHRKTWENLRKTHGEGGSSLLFFLGFLKFSLAHLAVLRACKVPEEPF